MKIVEREEARKAAAEQSAGQTQTPAQPSVVPAPAAEETA
jgi:hypothetical protein